MYIYIYIYITVINKINIGIYHKMVMSNIKLDVEVETKTMMTQRPPRVDFIQIRSKKIEFQLELRTRFETLQELDDIDTMSETITYKIQQSATRVARTIDKPLKSRILSSTRTVMIVRIEALYIELLKDIYTNTSMTVHLHKLNTLTINIVIAYYVAHSNIMVNNRLSPPPFQHVSFI